jgi:hypothetical protein
MNVNANTIWNIAIALAVGFVALLSISMGFEARQGAQSQALPEVTSEAFAFQPFIAEESHVELIPEVVEIAEVEQGQSKPTSKKRQKYKSAVLQVVANFQKTDVTINGIAYPEYFEPGEPEGVVLPAGGPYDVRVTYAGKTKVYSLYLRPNETRLLFVEIPGFSGVAPPVAARPAEKKEEPAEPAKEGTDPGKVTVYSKPPGTIIVDGTKMAEKTPGTVEVPNGRHEIQVEYEGGEVSEKKIVRVRDGSRIKLFFRERTTAP